MAVNPVPTTNAQRSVLTDELADVRAKYNEETDPEMRQQHARNIIALSRTLNNKATDWAPSDNPDPNYEAQVETMDAGGKTGEQTVMVDGVPHYFPAEATEEQILAALTPAQPQASQADVRKAEPAMPVTPRSDWLNKIAPVSGPEGLLPKVVTAPMDALNAGADWLGGQATDLATKAGASPNVAAGIGTVTNLGSMLAVPGPKVPELRIAKAMDRTLLAENPNTQGAVEALLNRTKDIVPTPGQVTGEASLAEKAARMAHPSVFEKTGKELSGAAEQFRRDVVNPADQPRRFDLGQAIQDEANAAADAVKERLRPTFDAADAATFKTNLQTVADRAKVALAEDAATPGRKLEDGERAYLQKVVDDIEKTGKAAVPSQNIMSTVVDASGKPQVIGQTAGAPAQPVQNTAAGTMDLLSTLKSKLRETPEYKPTLPYGRTITGMTDLADQAFTDAAAKQGGTLGRDLKLAQSQYREMMDTVHSGAIEKVLGKNPEDVGQHLWQTGNVSELRQLQGTLAIAEREGTMSSAKATELNRRLASGFLQEAVPTVEAAANWNQTLASKPKLRDTWDELTSVPNGQFLRNAMDVLEQAAKISKRDNKALLGDANIVIQRSAKLGLGFSVAGGVVSAPLAVAGIGIAAATRMLATAYTHGNQGILNRMTQVLKLSGVGTAAARRAIAEAMPVLQKFADQNGVNGLFINGQQ